MAKFSENFHLTTQPPNTGIVRQGSPTVTWTSIRVWKMMADGLFFGWILQLDNLAGNLLLLPAIDGCSVHSCQWTHPWAGISWGNAVRLNPYFVAQKTERKQDLES